MLPYDWVDQLQEEKEEREKEVVSYYNALEKARVENQDLQVQLGHAPQQALDPNSKDNSLLAEVDDRRLAMERQLNSMKISVTGEAQCIHQRADEQMKLQISTLLRMRDLKLS